jgi:hypothetical protein
MYGEYVLWGTHIAGALSTLLCSDISNNRLNRILSESQEGREKGREHQNHEIIFYDFSITIALIETLIGSN